MTSTVVDLKPEVDREREAPTPRPVRRVAAAPIASSSVPDPTPVVTICRRVTTYDQAFQKGRNGPSDLTGDERREAR